MLRVSESRPSSMCVFILLLKCQWRTEHLLSPENIGGSDPKRSNILVCPPLVKMRGDHLRRSPSSILVILSLAFMAVSSNMSFITVAIVSPMLITELHLTKIYLLFIDDPNHCVYQLSFSIIVYSSLEPGHHILHDRYPNSRSLRSSESFTTGTIYHHCGRVRTSPGTTSKDKR